MLFNLSISRDVDRLIVSHVAELQSFLEKKIIDLALSTSQDTYPHLSCDNEGKNLVDNFGRFEKEDAIFEKEGAIFEKLGTTGPEEGRQGRLPNGNGNIITSNRVVVELRGTLGLNASEDSKSNGNIRSSIAKALPRSRTTLSSVRTSPAMSTAKANKIVTIGMAKKTTHDLTRIEHPKRFDGAIQEAGIVGRVLGSMSPINILKQEAKQGKINGKTTSTGVELKNLALSRMTQSVSIVFFSASLLTMN